MNRMMKALGGLLLAATLVACGGGGGNPGTNPNAPVTPTTPTTPGTETPTTPAPVPASIDVFTSSPDLSSSAASSVTFSVSVKDAQNQAIPNQPVTFSATSGNLSGSLPTPTTGANGEAITKVSLSSGSDRSNRNIVVTVSAGGVSKQVTIPVTGTSLSLSGAGSVLVGGQTTFTARAVDSAGQPVPNATLSVTSSLGNTLAPSALTTNSTGNATFTYTGTNAGNDVLTLAGLGATTTIPVAVSAVQFAFEQPTPSQSLAVNSAIPVSVIRTNGGAPVVGATVNFSTTRGTLGATSVVTDANGRAQTTLNSSSSGPASITASQGTAQVTQQVTFVASTPATLILQANPGAVSPNTSGSTNQSTLSALVQDASGNPVSGVTVNFQATRDPSNGSISPGSATTGSNGTAVANFIAGPLSTANNGVEIKATVQGTAVSGTAALTVNQQALFIAIGMGNDITNEDPTTYKKQFSVQVTDANGAAVSGRSVTLSVIPTAYRKGRLTFTTPPGAWEATSSTSCPNEDVDRDGTLDAGEDTNGDSRLTPGLPVSVDLPTVTTDTSGRATFNLLYGENFVPWVTVDVTARTNVGGTESTKTLSYSLRGAASDFTSSSNPPAGQLSPFGTSTSCADAL